MATYNVPSHARRSFQAGNASLGQYQFVQVNSSGQLVTPAATGVFALILDDAPSITSGATYSNGLYSGGYTVGNYYGCVFPFGGIMKVITGASLTPGQAIMTDTSGHAIPAIAGAFVLGWAVAASNSGDVASFYFATGGHY